MTIRLNVNVENPPTALSKDSSIMESRVKESTEMDDDEDNGNLDSKSQSVTNKLLNVEDPPTALSNDSSIKESSIQESTKMNDDEVNGDTGANSNSVCVCTNIDDPTNATSQSSVEEVPAKKFPLKEISIYGNPLQQASNGPRDGNPKPAVLMEHFAALVALDDKIHNFLFSIYGIMDFRGIDVRQRCSIHLGRFTYAWAFQVTDDKEAILLTVQPMQIMKVGK